MTRFPRAGCSQASWPARIGVLRTAWTLFQIDLPHCSLWTDKALSVELGSGSARFASAALVSRFYPAAALMAAHGLLAVSWQCRPPGRSRHLAGWAAAWASVVFIRLVPAWSLSLVNFDLGRQGPHPTCLTPAREAATHLAQIASPSDLLLDQRYLVPKNLVSGRDPCVNRLTLETYRCQTP